MTLSYSKLKGYIIKAVVQAERYSEVWNSIKEQYKDGINSVRRFEQTDSIGQLLKVLEIRDILSEDNVDCLKHIARKLRNSKELLQKISEYENSQEDNELYYSPADIKIPHQESFMSTSTAPFTRHMSPKKKECIFQTVIEDIGSFWRDLARNLRIKECIIDDTDVQYKNVPDKAAKIMDIFQAKGDPDRWFFTLCNALEKTRRKDLVRDLQDIVSRNI